MKFDVYEYTSKGGRDYNEDCLGSAFGDNGGIFVVADGLGGHLLGERASEAAADTVISGWDTAAADVSKQLEELIIAANQNILALQAEHKTVMKTTIAALAISGNRAYIANSGDSRVYFIRNGEVFFYTNDHSVAFKKFKAKELTHDQIGSDEDQSRLLRTLGSTERYEPELYTPDVELKPGDAFLLCTDGAWEFIRDEEIAIDYLKSQNAANWVENMLLRVMERINGGNDNLSLLSVIVI